MEGYRKAHLDVVSVEERMSALRCHTIGQLCKYRQSGTDLDKGLRAAGWNIQHETLLKNQSVSYI